MAAARGLAHPPRSRLGLAPGQASEAAPGAAPCETCVTQSGSSEPPTLRPSDLPAHAELGAPWPLPESSPIPPAFGVLPEADSRIDTAGTTDSYTCAASVHSVAL